MRRPRLCSRRECGRPKPRRKAVHRIYVREGLQVRKRTRKRVSQAERWSMDFQFHLLATGQRVRTLNIVYDFSRECPAIEADT